MSEFEEGVRRIMDRELAYADYENASPDNDIETEERFRRFERLCFEAAEITLEAEVDDRFAMTEEAHRRLDEFEGTLVHLGGEDVKAA